MSEPTFTSDAGTRLVVHSAGSTDPRLILDERALVDASRNRFPVVAGARAKRDGAGLAAGGAVALLLGGLTFWTMSSHRTQHPVAAPLPQASPVSTPAPFHAVPLAAPTPGLRLPSVPSVAYSPAPGAEVRTGPAPVVVFDTGSSPAPVATAMAPAAAPTAPSHIVSSATPSGDNERFAAQVGEGQIPVATAQAMSNPSSTVTQGTLISAVLETAIDTDLPGYVRALVSQDVKSFDGSTVLIPRSSRLIGQYKSGLAAGQTRAYIIWSRLIRPDGASVALASPAVEYGGTSGLSGKVDGHFMKRFGSAVLLSVVGGLGAIGSGGTSVVLSSGGQSAAGVAASRDAQIPPTIRVAQGQPIRIFTARDLDFSSVGPVVASR
jgi:type IV secretion system protein VirB10